MIIYDIIGGNFYTNAATFNREGFEQKGARVIEYRQIHVNGYPAKYLVMQGDMISTVHALTFGDSTFSTMIMATFMNTDHQAGAELVRCINSICYDKNRKVSPFETALFSLNDNNSKFKFFTFNAIMHLYTLGGKDNTQHPDDPFIIVAQLPSEGNTPKSLAATMLSKTVEHGLNSP